MSCFLSIDGEKRGALCRSNVVLFMVQFYYNVSIENYGVSIPIARKHPFYWIEDLLAHLRRRILPDDSKLLFRNNIRQLLFTL